MIIRNTNLKELTQALSATNKKYKNNVIFQSIECKTQNGKTWHVRLRVKDSKKAGAKLGYSYPAMYGNEGQKARRTISACWHVHGDFFDALLSINNNAIIKTGKSIINIDGGNWRDYNAGSMIYPQYASEQCHCGE